MPQRKQFEILISFKIETHLFFSITIIFPTSSFVVQFNFSDVLGGWNSQSGYYEKKTLQIYVCLLWLLIGKNEQPNCCRNEHREKLLTSRTKKKRRKI